MRIKFFVALNYLVFNVNERRSELVLSGFDGEESRLTFHQLHKSYLGGCIVDLADVYRLDQNLKIQRTEARYLILHGFEYVSEMLGII